MRATGLLLLALPLVAQPVLGAKAGAEVMLGSCAALHLGILALTRISGT